MCWSHYFLSTLYKVVLNFFWRVYIHTYIVSCTRWQPPQLRHLREQLSRYIHRWLVCLYSKLKKLQLLTSSWAEVLKVAKVLTDLKLILMQFLMWLSDVYYAFYTYGVIHLQGAYAKTVLLLLSAFTACATPFGVRSGSHTTTYTPMT